MKTDPENQETPSKPNSGAGGDCAPPDGSVWCVVCQGGDEISEPMLLQDGLTEAEARKIAEAAPQSMWAITTAWPKAQYDAWKKQRDELWSWMRGSAPQKLVMFSTPDGGESLFYRAWMDSQNGETSDRSGGRA